MCGDWFFDDPELESPSPEPVYQLGVEKIGPLTCLGILLFIDYLCFLCCPLTNVNTPFAWQAPSSRLPCPCQVGMCLVGPVVAATWGPTGVRPIRGHPGSARGGRRHWPVGSSHPEVPRQLHFLIPLAAGRWSNRIWFCLKKIRKNYLHL